MSLIRPGTIVLLVVFAIVAGVEIPVGAQTPCSVQASPISTATPSVPTSERVSVGESEALLWNPSATHAVLLVHGAMYDAESWRPQVEVIARTGFAVLSLEEIGADDVLAGIDFLRDDCPERRIVVIGASAGASGAMSALASGPDGIAGLIVLAGSGDVSELGDFPKLFVASEEEGIAGTIQSLAESAPGDDNRVLILPGSAHAQAVFTTDQGPALLDAILAFIEEATTTA
ncbi:MAG: alpha/beta hydrolase family protein [Thermomicrobiales bacterium]